MLLTSNALKNNFKDYKNINCKISNDAKNGKLIKLKNGLYETDINTPIKYVAGAVYGPSYISFESALEYYGLIPERVYGVSSATNNKKKKKNYNTPLGNLSYRDVPTEAYPYEVVVIEENGYSYQIATAEKALCDKLYTLKPVKNIREMKELLFENLRIDENEFDKLDPMIIALLSEKYRSTNIDMLVKYLNRRFYE